MTGYTPPSSSTASSSESAPWGHKITVVMYFPGEPTEEDVEAILEVHRDYANDGAAFIGISVDVVNDEPTDQTAT